MLGLAGACTAHVRPAPPVDPVRLDAAIRGAGDRLRALVQPDGSFIYAYHVRDGRSAGGYNIVRHAGAIYALAMFEQLWPDPRTRAAIARARDYLLRAIRPAGEGASAVFRMDAPGVVEDDTVLGATGLGLVALLAADALEPGSVPIETLRSLGRFILYMQRADGSFASTYAPDAGRTDRFDSLYYPGEAILALVELAARDRDPAWHEAALRGMRFLAHSRERGRDVPADNWALVATQALFARGDLGAADRELFARHAALIAGADLAGQVLDPASAIYGCFTHDGRTTPSATRLEGLLAASALLPAERIATPIAAGIGFLLASQLADGALPGDQHRLTVRIDYIQHALSALIRYRAWGRSAARNPAPS